MKICTITQCGKPLRARGLCVNHYNQSLRREEFITRPRQVHHGSETPAYSSWASLKDRALNPKSKDYWRYGAIGKTCCQGIADSFGHFLSIVGPRPEGMSIDRIDGNEGYWCGSCEQCTKLKRKINIKWSTVQEQMDNRGMWRNNQSGTRGVAQKKNGWYAYLYKNGKNHHLGVFKSKKDAINARRKAESTLVNIVI